MEFEKKLNLTGIIIWLVCAIFFTYEFLLRTVLGTFQAPIMDDLRLSPFTFALVSTTAYSLVYAAMQMPVGIFANRYGLKKSLLLACGLCAFSAAFFASCAGLLSAITSRVLMGLGSSFGFICLLIAVYDWMPSRYYGLYIGLSQFLGTLGPMLAAGPLNALAINFNINWRFIFFNLSFFGLALTLLVFLFVKGRDNKEDKYRVITRPKPLKANLISLFSQKQTWLIALYSSLIYFALEYLSENEGKAFIEHQGYSTQFSSYMISVSWLGYAVGCPILGYLSDRLKRRKIFMILAAFCSLLSLITIVYLPFYQILLIVAFFLLGFGASGLSLGFALMGEQCSKAYLAMGLGFNNATISLFTAINAPLFGWLLSYLRQDAGLSIENYRFIFSLIIGYIFIALTLAMFYIQETFCRSQNGFTVISPPVKSKKILLDS